MPPVSRVLCSVVAAVAIAVPVSVVPGPASAARAADPVVPVPPTGSVTVTGYGYGHGHGMSQHGARQAAANGVSHTAILEHYYPGTRMSALRGRIRILLTRDTDNNTIVLPRRGLRVKDVATGRSWWLPTRLGAKLWRLSVVNGRTKVSYRTDRWRTFRPGGRARLVGDGQFYSRRGPVTLRTAAGDRAYRGALRLANRDTVNVLGLQRYLKGVVASEMPASWPADALNAQTVAARTYAAYERAAHAGRYYHLCDTTSCQVYNGVAVEDRRTNAAVDATAGQILTYGGAPAFTQFSASNGGWMSAGSRPYLVWAEDPYDVSSTVNRHHGWTKEISFATLQRKYGSRVGTVTGIRVLTRERNAAFGSGGWAIDVEVRGDNGTIVVKASEIRSLAGLRSTYFTFSP
ncbi:MAG TPA: SpoIID/LytB domain-containing protein [Marmoricola sp.]